MWHLELQTSYRYIGAVCIGPTKRPAVSRANCQLDDLCLGQVDHADNALVGCLDLISSMYIYCFQSIFNVEYYGVYVGKSASIDKRK